MSIKKVKESELFVWVDSVINKQKVIGVQAKGERFAFAPLAKAENLRLDYDVTILPPKQFFLPVGEDLISFDGKGTFKSIIENEPFVLFGVHPYDMVAVNQMGEIFSKDHYDVHYMSRRNAATIVVCDIQTASPNIFAGCMGTATVENGFDVCITKVGTDYVVEAKTDKGEALAAYMSEAAEADAVSLGRREQVREDNRKLLKKHVLNMRPEVLPKLLENSYDHPVWEENAKKCFSCGSCVMVCPTCYCFDVRDDVGWDLKSGRRIRTWDGCMLQDFAKVSGGHNFRKQKTDRYRHRFFRKGKYVPDKIGAIACVGCGRCITACVAKIANPVEVFNRLMEGE